MMGTRRSIGIGSMLHGVKLWSRRAIPLAILLGAGLALAGSLLAGTTAEAATPEAPDDQPLYLWVAGETAAAYPLPASLLATLARDVSPDSSESLLLRPDLAAAPPETLDLPAPIIAAPLPKVAAQILLPTPNDPRTLVITRAGVVAFRSDKPHGKPAIHLPGWDIAQAARAADGTIYLLERTFDEVLEGALPAPLLSWKGGDDVPDTIATCTKGSSALVLAPGDSLIWVPRWKARNLDRVVRRGDQWIRREVALVPPAAYMEDAWNISIGFPDPPNRSLFFAQRRGLRPELFEMLADGTGRSIYTWGRGLRCINGAVAEQKRILVMNGLSNVSLLNLDTFDEWSVPFPRVLTAVTISPDSKWFAMAALSADGKTTEVHIARRGSARTARAKLSGTVSAVALQIAPPR